MLENRRVTSKNSKETMILLLLHCPVAIELCNFVFLAFGEHCIIPKTVKDLLQGW